MKDSPTSLSSANMGFSPPIAEYTSTTAVPNKQIVEHYIDELSYQHDAMTTIQISWVLQQMPDYQKRFPYFGVPLSGIGELVDEHEIMQRMPVQASIGLKLDHDQVLTIDDAPAIDGEVNLPEFRALITNSQSSADRLFQDISLFGCQYTNVDGKENSHNVVYVDDPREYDYFIIFKDEFVLQQDNGNGDQRTGSVFHGLDAVTFTDTITGLLQLKSQMLVDTYREKKMATVYANRFVKPLVSTFAASQETHNSFESVQPE